MNKLKFWKEIGFWREIKETNDPFCEVYILKLNTKRENEGGLSIVTNTEIEKEEYIKANRIDETIIKVVFYDSSTIPWNEDVEDIFKLTVSIHKGEKVIELKSISSESIITIQEDEFTNSCYYDLCINNEDNFQIRDILPIGWEKDKRRNKYKIEDNNGM